VLGRPFVAGMVLWHDLGGYFFILFYESVKGKPFGYTRCGNKETGFML
jgi:hypothetical protein